MAASPCPLATWALAKSNRVCISAGVAAACASSAAKGAGLVPLPPGPHWPLGSRFQVFLCLFIQAIQKFSQPLNIPLGQHHAAHECQGLRRTAAGLYQLGGQGLTSAI